MLGCSACVTISFFVSIRCKYEIDRDFPIGIESFYDSTKGTVNYIVVIINVGLLPSCSHVVQKTKKNFVQRCICRLMFYTATFFVKFVVVINSR